MSILSIIQVFYPTQCQAALIKVSSRAHQSVADSITNVKRCGLSSKYPIQFSCHIYRPQTKFAKVMFLHVSVSHSVHGGACVVTGLGGGRAWLLGGMHGCGGHVWLWGGMRGCRGGHALDMTRYGQ